MPQRPPTRAALIAEIRALRARLAVIEHAAAATRRFAGHAGPGGEAGPLPGVAADSGGEPSRIAVARGPHESATLAESERRRRTAEKLAEVGRLLSQSLDPHEVSQRIADSVLALLDARLSVVYQVVESSGDLLALAVAGDAGSLLRPAIIVPRQGSVAGLAVRERRPVLVGDVLADPRVALSDALRAAAERLDHRAALAVPLEVEHRVVGALAVADRANRVFGEEEIGLVCAFADQAALAVRNSRLHERLQAALEVARASQDRLVEAERLDAVGQLASGVAHHLNNLLMVILGRVQLVRHLPPGPELREALSSVEDAALHGAELIRRLQAFAEVQATAAAAPVDLEEVAAEAIEATRERWDDEARARGVQIGVTLERGGVPAVAGEHRALRECLEAIIVNAVEALTASGAITIATWSTEGAVYCSIADTGTGMPAEVRRRALEPFFTTRGPQRAGLGLSLGHGIVTRLGGELRVESVEGAGTVVTLRLPRISPGSAGGAPAR
jgi:signal transduction histidine kinase